MAQPELKAIEEHRRQLVAESQRLREQLDADLAPLRAAAGYVEKGCSAVRSLAPYAPLLAAAAGFLVVRKKGGFLRLLKRAWSASRVALKLFGTIRSVVLRFRAE
ncbi:hypothetical protein SBV1_1220062 [Verrucomicrobia bacterium]|nr:hypothetical protein SBV1_1220062 [Verrucomicrobiota bacterium]